MLDLPKNVLIVDDDHFSLKVLSKMISSNYNVITVIDGSDAIIALSDKNKPIDIVISDCYMKDFNGLYAAKLIRTGFRNISRNIPIILISGRNNPSLISRSKELDVNEFLIKPVEKNVIFEKMLFILNNTIPLKEINEYSSISTDL